ncbi:GAF and ANTAR domain-containing protein [Micromonospora sp. HM134]|uniref:GAF and ANTAR domain-containing protein n=1 Tax=unclassified Micromonospora TaxID=2617518 RepID=UPI001198B5AF|nr:MULTISPECIES: GAF and ANTAR domain-containing protein [unclassified Micromonospora]QDY08940.1 GAF and ANTAR domain-containing protein [Micromonospora sp. HM134]
MAPLPLSPQDALVELSRIRLDEASLDEVLQLIADLARRSLPGVAEVSVTLLRGGSPQSVAVTGDVALLLDEWQYRQGHGPCLDAAITGDTLLVSDTATEERWPAWAARAVDGGIGSTLAIGLPIQEAVVGALNLYGPTPRAFDAESVELARTFAAYAAVALANAHLYASTASLAEQMRAAMESRAVIEQAKGIIMGQRRCTADEAFGILARLSQDTNRSLRDVAAALVGRATSPTHSASASHWSGRVG